MSLREQKMVLKPWGHEIIFAVTKDYIGKVLVIREGHQLSLQFHRVKEETIYLNRGEMLLTFEKDDGTLAEMSLHAGQSHHIPPNRKHRMKAITECEIFEVSTPHLEDVVRLEDSYGRVPESGTTT